MMMNNKNYSALSNLPALLEIFGRSCDFYLWLDERVKFATDP